MVLSSNTICKQFRDWLLLTSGLTWSESRVNWTREIKQFFGDLGVKLGYNSLYSSSGRGRPEYLIDLVWLNEGTTRHIQLALESELTKPYKKGVLEDFIKLLDVKSYINIGIFQLNANKEEEIINDMLLLLNKHIITDPKEIYLVIFLRYDNSTNEIIFSGYDLDYKGTRHEPINIERFNFPS